MMDYSACSSLALAQHSEHEMNLCCRDSSCSLVSSTAPLLLKMSLLRITPLYRVLGPQLILKFPFPANVRLMFRFWHNFEIQLFFGTVFSTLFLAHFHDSLFLNSVYWMFWHILLSPPPFLALHTAPIRAYPQFNPFYDQRFKDRDEVSLLIPPHLKIRTSFVLISGVLHQRTKFFIIQGKDLYK